MPSPHQFRLPDVGEGLTEADILTWMVAPGDKVTVNQILVEIETVKASVELPSPYAGTVTTLHVTEGETVAVGTPIITIDTGDDNGAGADPEVGTTAAATTSAGPASETRPVETAPPTAGPAAALLVGYGPRTEAPVRKRRGPVPAPTQPSTRPETAGQQHARPAAKPPVRKLAKDLGVDLYTVTPTGADGVITRDDVHRAEDRSAEDRSAEDRSAEDRSAEDRSASPTAAMGARETRIPIRGVRKHTARAMVESAFTAPHVTEFVTVDVTETMRLRNTVAARREFHDVKLSPLVFVARALLLAIQRTPEINAHWDESAQEIVLKHYVNLGIAAATDRGLVVPNIKGADQLSLHELATSITGLAATARSGKTTPADMAGGTITITNVGVFGVDTGTPILNPGEAAILALGTVRRQPWVVGTGADERVEPRWLTQLALSFDHRLVDGQQGSQALADIADVLHDPGLAML